MKNNETFVRLDHVTKEYLLGKTVVTASRDIDLSVFYGDFLVIAGPSGSGKTTLLNLIGLIDKPSSGKLFFLDEDVTQVPLNKLYLFRRKSIGYIFQTFNLFPVLSTFENVEYPLILTGMNKAARREKVDSILNKVGLYDRRAHKPNQLSGGQRQRVAIARAVVKEPALILADEPTANLDTKTGLEILQLMKKINKDENITFVFSTNDPMVIDEGEKIVRIRDGALENSEGGKSLNSKIPKM